MPVDKIKVAVAVHGDTKDNEFIIRQFIHLLEKQYTCSGQDWTLKNVEGNNATTLVKLDLENPLPVIQDLRTLLSFTARDYGVQRFEALNFRTRVSHVVAARTIIMFVLAHRRNMSHTAIARLLGAKGHATVLKALEHFNVPKEKPIDVFYQRGDLENVYEDAKRRYERGPKFMKG